MSQRSSAQRLRRASTVLLTTAALTWAAGAVEASGTPGRQPTTPDALTPSSAKEARPPWRDLGRVSGSTFATPMVASSRSGVSLVVAPGSGSYLNPGVSLIQRRTRNGHAAGVERVLGEVIGINVDPRGNALVVALHKGEFIALTWPRTSQRPRIRTIDDGYDGGHAEVKLLANKAGDAALVELNHGFSRSVIIRKPAGRPWKKPIKVGQGYSAILDDLAIGSEGELVGAFRDANHTVALRTLTLGERRFGRARKAVAWPALADISQPHGEIALVALGPRGDRMITLGVTRSLDPTTDQSGGSSRPDAQPYGYRSVIFGSHGKPWRGQTWGEGFLGLPVVGLDGSVTLVRTSSLSRWTPQTREFRNHLGLWYKASDPNGDLLIGTGKYRGRLRIWPAGKRAQREVRSPPGYGNSWDLSADGTAYVITQREGSRPGFYLFSASLDH